MTLFVPVGKFRFAAKIEDMQRCICFQGLSVFEFAVCISVFAACLLFMYLFCLSAARFHCCVCFGLPYGFGIGIVPEVSPNRNVLDRCSAFDLVGHRSIECK